MNRIAQATSLLALTAALPLGAADYFPLATGNTWTYQSTSTNESFTIRVGTPIQFNDNVYYSLTGYGDRRLFVRAVRDGVSLPVPGANPRNFLVYLDEDTQQEILLTSFEPFEGGFWEAPHRGCDQQGQTLVRGGSHSGAGGSWESVLQIQYRVFGCADTGVEAEQYAENIGLVRRTVTTIAGPRTFDLTYARVNSVRIEPRDRGSFTVSAVPARERNGWDAIARVDLNNTPSIRLGFPTSQVVEAVLRNESGQEVWKLSDGQFFAPAETSREISGDFANAFFVPFPIGIAPGEPGFSSVYTLEAWLVNSSGPKFYSAVKVVRPVSLPTNR